jgi:hypothetical protein
VPVTEEHRQETLRSRRECVNPLKGVAAAADAAADDDDDDDETSDRMQEG